MAKPTGHQREGGLLFGHPHISPDQISERFALAAPDSISLFTTGRDETAPSA